MTTKPCLAVALGAMLFAGAESASQAASPLNADKLIVALRPETPSDRNYLAYTAAVMDAGFLPPYLVESTFLWAREKPEHMARYFRRALTIRADKVGIDLPQGEAPVSGTVQGQVVFLNKIGPLKITVPVANATVRLGDRVTSSDADGRFVFSNVPFGQYTVSAEAKVLLINRHGSIRVALPTRPPSLEPAQVTVYIR